MITPVAQTKGNIIRVTGAKRALTVSALRQFLRRRAARLNTLRIVSTVALARNDCSPRGTTTVRTADPIVARAVRPPKTPTRIRTMITLGSLDVGQQPGAAPAMPGDNTARSAKITAGGSNPYCEWLKFVGNDIDDALGFFESTADQQRRSTESRVLVALPTA